MKNCDVQRNQCDKIWRWHWREIEIDSFNETNYVQRELTSSQRAHMSENDHWKLGLMVNSHLSTLAQIQ